MRFRTWRCVLILFLFLNAPTAATAGTMLLLWDPSPDVNVQGYVVYVGVAPGQYFAAVDVGNLVAVRVINATAGRSYYFAVAAYSAAKVVGPLSAEVSGQPSATALLLDSDPVNQRVGQLTELHVDGLELPEMLEPIQFNSPLVAEHAQVRSLFPGSPSAATSIPVPGLPQTGQHSR